MKKLQILVILLCTGPVLGQAAVLKSAFARWDKDKNGKVTRAEYPGSDDQFKSMDKNKNGTVTFKEFEASPVAKRLIAYRDRMNKEARERLDPKKLISARLAALARHDKNRDGKVTKAEWNGSPEAFAELDLDKNGVIDKKDRALAKTKSEPTVHQRIKQFRTYVPKEKELLKRYDKNKDSQLSRTELGNAKIAKVFDIGDRNGDKKLDERELRGLVGAINGWVYMRNRGVVRPKAYTVLFAAWDKNKDGRIDIKEWPADKKYLFKRIDINRDAGVTREEVERYKRAFEGENFIEKHDLNGDGKVTFQEFGGSRAAFQRADRNGDGVISTRDG